MSASEETYTQSEIFTAFKKVAVNSTIMCVLSFGLVNLLHNFIWYSGAHHYVKEPILLYNYVEFIRNIGWYPRAVKIIYSAGSWLCIVMAILSYAAFYVTPRKNAAIRLFWFWFFINSVNYVLAQWMANPYVNYSGVGVLVRYWYWDERDRFVAALIALILVIFYGRFFAHNFLQFSPAMKFMKRNNYKVFSIYVLLIPMGVLMILIGSLRLLHHWNVNIIMVLATFLMAVSTYIRIGEKNFKVSFFEDSYKIKYSLMGFLFLLLAIGIYLYLYFFGFQFQENLF